MIHLGSCGYSFRYKHQQCDKTKADDSLKRGDRNDLNTLDPNFKPLRMQIAAQRLCGLSRSMRVGDLEEMACSLMGYRTTHELVGHLLIF